MAITQAICNSFKSEILEGVHVITTDTFKIALFTSSATLNQDTTAYSSTNEISGTGYSAGGATMSGASVTVSNNTAIIDFSDVAWSSASFTARGALIYNSSKSNKAVAVLNFGSDRTVSNGTFTVTIPSANSSQALLRLS